MKICSYVACQEKERRKEMRHRRVRYFLFLSLPSLVHRKERRERETGGERERKELSEQKEIRFLLQCRLLDDYLSESGAACEDKACSVSSSSMYPLEQARPTLVSIAKWNTPDEKHHSQRSHAPRTPFADFYNQSTKHDIFSLTVRETNIELMTVLAIIASCYFLLSPICLLR